MDGRSPHRDEIAAAIITLAGRRGRAASFCPSEVTRAVATDWQPLIGIVCEVAGELVAAGLIVATQKGMPADPATARGAIRQRLR